MPHKKKIIISLIIFLIIILASVSMIRLNNKIEWKLAEEAIASAGFSYQIGLTNAIVIPCVTSGKVCTGGTLCATKDSGTCTLYSDVSGTPAGGMGSNALFMKTSIAMAGLTSGGQLIAGGMSPVLMDKGVFASAGGCYGCMADASWSEKLIKKFKVFIAGFKDDGK